MHRSMSIRGTDDLAFTKANFIRHLLTTHKKPILYLDADCEFASEPELIDQLVMSGCDFAIYNGFADDRTDRFVPVKLNLSSGVEPTKNRYYRFSGSARWFSSTQLVCSGCTQFYGNSLAVRALLSKWHQTIAAFPGSADDACLDFVFNNLSRRSWLSWLLHVTWLPKSYARYAWWIHTKPIINHPDFPADGSSFTRIKDPKGRKRAYFSRMRRRDPASQFAPNSIIDTEQHMLCKLVDDKIVPIEPIVEEFWL